MQFFAFVYLFFYPVVSPALYSSDYLLHWIDKLCVLYKMDYFILHLLRLDRWVWTSNYRFICKLSDMMCVMSDVINIELFHTT